MILIKCCASCAYYNGDGLCNSRESLNTNVHPNDGCDEWKDRKIGTRRQTMNEPKKTKEQER